MNPAVAAIPPSLIRSINARKRPGDIDLGLGEPTLRPDLEPLEAALEWVRGNGCPYTSNAGLEPLREAVVARYGSPRFTRPTEVCITVGSEEALYLAIKSLIDPATDEVLVVEPCYLAYVKICAMEGIRYRMVPLAAEGGFRPRAQAVLDALRPETRLVILNSPGNPTGRVWPAAELEALARGLSTAARPVFVLADEVYRELYYTPDPPASIAAWHPYSLLAGSLSKSNAMTGMRLGWLIGPDEVIGGAVKVHQFVNTAASTFSQVAALEIFRRPERLAAHRDWYLENLEVLTRTSRHAEMEIIPPEGAFYALVRLPGERVDSLGTAERLLEHSRVVTVPGRAFGDSAEGWLRISWVVPPDQLREGIERIGRFLASQRG
jgi:aspartate/methionine/tyrosine aminotransferase